MIPRLDKPRDLPGQERVIWRGAPASIVGAVAAAVAWPPLIVTLFVWPPHNWMPDGSVDWRLIVLLVGLIAVPLGLWILLRERNRSGRPGSRLGVIWRFMLYGGLLSAAVAVAFAIGQVIASWFEAGDFMQALGATETKLLIYGVGGLPISILVGVSYALWAGICVAFIAFSKAPAEVRDRLGLMNGDPG